MLLLLLFCDFKFPSLPNLYALMRLIDVHGDMGRGTERAHMLQNVHVGLGMSTRHFDSIGLLEISCPQNDLDSIQLYGIEPCRCERWSWTNDRVRGYCRSPPQPLEPCRVDDGSRNLDRTPCWWAGVRELSSIDSYHVLKAWKKERKKETEWIYFNDFFSWWLAHKKGTFWSISSLQLYTSMVLIQNQVDFPSHYPYEPLIQIHLHM